ncbi:MAG: ATP-binding cassette domain-containing protein [Turicibacter sp.]|nr:ATP-binding cassette domain-containing protein [Turicibacter sp.]
MKKILLDIKGLEVCLGGKTIVQDINLPIYEGETLSLVGESGSGKSTIGRAILGLNPVSRGEVIFDGKNIENPKTKALKRFVQENIQMIFQDPASSLNERANVDYIISEGITNFKRYKNEAQRKHLVGQALESVGLLAEHGSRYPHEFSGGQRQRIGIARAMIMDPRLIVADEPISALDVSIRAQVLNLLQDFQKTRGLSYLFIAHDLSVVRYISHRIAVIQKGRIVEIAPAETLFNNPLHPYTQSLLSALPIPDPILERKKKRALHPSSQAIPSGTLKEVAPGHFVLRP